MPRLSIACAVLAGTLVSCAPVDKAGIRDAGMPSPLVQTAVLKNNVLRINGLVKNRALLVRGTEMIQGLPLAADNSVPALYGEYLFGVDASSDAEAAPLYETAVPSLLFRVWYTATPVVMGDEWKPVTQKGLPAKVMVLRRENLETKREVWLYDSSMYRLFLETPLGFEKSAAFLLVFSERFAYYARYAASPNDYSFPAQVDL